MKLVDMKIPKKTKKEMKEESVVCCSDDYDKWPYGLRLRFESREIEKLPELLNKKVGDKCKVYAEATVINVRMSENQKGKKDHTVELQIEGMDVQPVKPLYSKKMTPKEYREFRKVNDDE